MSELNQVKTAKLKKFKRNPENPRTIKDTRFAQLVKSITEFPEMLTLRPIIVNNENDMMILGGDKRYTAAEAAGFKELPYISADKLTPQEQKQLILKDNTHFGEWNYEMLANDFSEQFLFDAGIYVPSMEAPVDYTILEDFEPGNISQGVRHGIEIEFSTEENYKRAYELNRDFKKHEINTAQILIKALEADHK